MMKEDYENTFIIFRSFVNGIRRFDNDTIAEAFLAYADYALDGKQPETDNPVVKLALESHIPNIDAAKLRYKNCVKNGMKGKEYGKLGGRPRKGESKEEYKERKKIDNEIENKPLQKPLITEEEKTPRKPLITEEEKTPRKPLQKPLYIDKDIDIDFLLSISISIYNTSTSKNNIDKNLEKNLEKIKDLIESDKITKKQLKTIGGNFESNYLKLTPYQIKINDMVWKELHRRLEQSGEYISQI